MVRDEETSPEQFEAFRRMTAETRLVLAEALYWSAREWKAIGLRKQHMDWTEEQISAEVTRLFLHASN
jgi:hypothetical protein